MKSLWFIVPAHGRVDLTRVCLRQLARTCDELTARGLHASAVVIADDENLDTAASLGFATVERENRPLGRRWNDGFELAGRNGVDYVVPFGSDDWVDATLIRENLPGHGEVRCSTLSAVVREDAGRLARLKITYDGGDGIRTYATSTLHELGYRPMEDDRDRAMDTSLLRGVSRALKRPPKFVYRDVHPLQIVDWKSASTQLNSFDACLTFQHGPLIDPWEALEGVYPAEALAEMRALHGSRDRVAA